MGSVGVYPTRYFNVAVVMTARVVHCKQEPYDVLIDRTTKWGNPYAIGLDGSRDFVCDKYEDYFWYQTSLIDDIHELKDKILGCWCKDKRRRIQNRCHGDFLAKLADLA